MTTSRPAAAKTGTPAGKAGTPAKKTGDPTGKTGNPAVDKKNALAQKKGVSSMDKKNLATRDKKTAQTVARALKSVPALHKVKSRVTPKFSKPKTLRLRPKDRNYRVVGVPQMRQSPFKLLLRPVTTEFAMKKIEEANTLVFYCHPKATKRTIKMSVRQLYGVNALRINTLNQMDQLKKAFVVLPPDTDALDVANRIGIL